MRLTSKKRANSARAGLRRFRIWVGLALAGSLAGGMTVGTKRTCYGEATAKVETSIVRHGPKGTAAEYRSYLPSPPGCAGVKS